MSIKQILNNKELVNSQLTIKGWVLTVREQKENTFIKVNDGSCFNGIQLILPSQLLSDKINTGASIYATGILVESPAQGQDYEIRVSDIQVIGFSNPLEYPLAKTKLSLDYLRTINHLRFRTNTFGSVFRIKSSINQGTHEFFKKNNYFHLDPNIMTINECEGGAGVFQVTEKDITEVNKLKVVNGKYDWTQDHFSKPVYLTVSSQLQLEAIACSLGSVYTTNKSFRSEHSNTNKHLSEFSHLEIESAFITLEQLMDVGERYIKFIGQYLLDNNMDDIENLNKFISKGLKQRIVDTVNCSFNKIRYVDAIKLIKENKIEAKYGDDLSSEMENFLTNHYNGPVFVTHWPLSIKSFYMKQTDNGECECFDLLMPHKIGEIIGGSMREDSLDKIQKIMDAKGISGLDFYLDLRRFGSVPHGGFGLGLDRLCMLYTGMESIKDVVPFPVFYNNCEF